MININGSLAEAIKKNLPEAVGTELKKRLIEADEMQVELTKNAAQLRHNEVTITDLRKLKINKVELERISIDLEVKREMVEKENRDIFIKDLQYQLNAEKRVTHAYDNILRGLVRNTEYKSSTFGNVPAQSGSLSLHTSENNTSIAE